MTAAYTTLKIYDPTDTADLVDGVNFQLLYRSFAPVVAGRRRMNLANRGPYVDVVERITITIVGSTGAAALANLSTLSELLDRAERFAAGDQLDPVLYQIQPQGSALDDPLAALILGRPPNAPSINLPVSFNEKLFRYEISPVELQFVRRGLLVGTAENTINVTAAANPTIREATFASHHPVPSPVRLTVTGWSESEHLNVEAPSVLFIAAESQDLLIIEAEGLTETNFTSVDQSSNKASGGNVLRFTAPDTDEHISGDYEIDSADFNRDTEEIAVYAMLKGHASKDFLVWVETASYVFNSAYRTRSPFIVAAGEYTTPTPVYLGSLAQRRGHQFIRLIVQALDSTGSPTIDIDYLVLVALKSTTYVLQLGEMWLSSPFIDTGANVSIVIDPQPLAALAPFVGYRETSNSNEAELDSQGDGSLYMPGDTLATLWMGKRGNFWVDTEADNTPTSVGMTVTRSPGYLTPQ